MKTATTVQLNRRKLLLAVTAGAGAAAAVATVGLLQGRPHASAGGAKSESGYRLTDHVRNYYRTASV